MKFVFILFHLFYISNAFSISFWNGKWKPPNHNLSFIVENDQVFAKKDDAILSMDLYDIEKENNIYKIMLKNLKICETGKPKFNMELLRVLKYIHIISNEGLELEINELSLNVLEIKWKIDSKNGTFVVIKDHHNINNSTSDPDTDLYWINSLF